MTALKGKAIAQFLARPDLDRGVVLVYGPDAGLVEENAAKLAALAASDPADPESVVTLHMSEIEADPQRLGVAARTPSLFGDGKVIRIRAATGKLGPTLSELLAEGIEALIIVEAGDLRPADALRKLAEQRPDARALPCYADTSQTIQSLIRQTLSESGIAAEPDLVPLLADLLGNDRQVTRRELEKLVLYALESRTLRREDVTLLCGDNAALALDSVLDAMGTGHAGKFDEAVTRARGAGMDMQRLLAAGLQHFTRLRAMRAQIEAGAPAEDVLRKAVPRIHFSRTALMAQQLRLWNEDSLAAACSRLHRAIAESRKQQMLAAPIARQAMLAVCLAAARR